MDKLLNTVLEALEADACVDKPSPRDIKFDEVFWGPDTELPKRVVLNNTRAQNQNEPNNPSTKYGCVFFTATHIINEENYIESPSTYNEIQWKDICKIAIDRKLLAVDSWAFLQSGPKLSMDLGHTSGYTQPKTLEEVKRALAMNQLVQFGTRSWDWKKTFQHPNHVVQLGKCYGHSMSFEWFDDSFEWGVLIVRNSMWQFAPFLGRQFLRYSDFDSIFPGRYAYVDKKNEETIQEAQKKNRLKLAQERGYWNGQKPNDFATRYEASRVAIRIAKFYGINIPENKIWNMKDGNANVIVQDLKVMFEKASGNKFSFDLWPGTNKITRSDMVCLAVRI